MFRFVGRTTIRDVTARFQSASSISNNARCKLLSTLAILEQREGQLNHGSLGAIAAAKKLGGSVHGFVAGGNIGKVVEEAAKVEGVEKIIAVENTAYDKVLGSVTVYVRRVSTRKLM